MEQLIVRERLDYTGSELTPHFIYRKFGVLGDAIIAFQGEASVRENLVDLEDSRTDSFIYSPLMLSFLIEHFGMPLKEACARQRLLMAIIMEELPQGVSRIGDDLFFREGKLSVSIATVSPVSALIHSGLNIRAEGCPVKVSCLEEMNVEPLDLAQRVLNRYVDEHQGISRACCKVQPR